MFRAKPERPYLSRWLRRTRRQLLASGRLRQVAWLLRGEEGRDQGDWETYLRAVLEERETPSVEVLTRIESLLSVKRMVAEEDGQLALGI